MSRKEHADRCHHLLKQQSDALRLGVPTTRQSSMEMVRLDQSSFRRMLCRTALRDPRASTEASFWVHLVHLLFAPWSGDDAYAE